METTMPGQNAKKLPYLCMTFQTGHWMKGLAIVAKLICQAKVDADQSGPNA